MTDSSLGATKSAAKAAACTAAPAFGPHSMGQMALPVKGQ